VLATTFTSPRSVLDDECARLQTLASQHEASGPLLDAHWMSSWLEGFARPTAFLLCAREHGLLVGVAALQHVIERWRGAKIRVVQSLTNIESYRYEFLAAEGRPDVARHLWRALCSAGQADVIRLDHVPARSPTLAAGLDLAREHGWRRVVVEETFLTPRRALSTADAWDLGLTSKFKSNLRNREHRLSARGDVGFDVVTADGDLPRALEVFCRLEASGWKGQLGTAVDQRDDVRRFYGELIARARDDVWIPLLTVSGTPIAAQLLRVCGGIIFMLKTAYDQAYAQYAPGHLLTARLVQCGIERGMKVLDFLADNAAWKADWATGFLPHRSVSLFAPTLAGRYAYWTRYGVPEQVKRVPGAAPFVRWIRSQRS
jgi:CelD/BcsL family acetyltransferase involved in cellulose biosynthesis